MTTNLPDPRRRRILGAVGATLATSGLLPSQSWSSQTMKNDDGTPELILHNGRFTTLDRSNPAADAVAIRSGRFTRVGRAEDILALAGSDTRVIDLQGRRVLPG